MYLSFSMSFHGLITIFFKILFIYLFIYFFWLCWVFVFVRGLSLVAASGGHSSSRCTGLSPSQPLLLRSTGSRRTGSVIVAHGPCCSAACGTFPDQGSNPCLLHWQADSQPLHHQGSPWLDNSLVINNITLSGCTSLFIYSPTEGYLCCFSLWGIMDKTARNRGLSGPKFSTSLGKYQGV